MESLELRIFREVAYEKSISRAAENLNYVQSNVTAHIKRLESELGATLFIRHGKGVTITPDGEKLLHYADSILNLLDRAVSDFQKETLALRIGAAQTLASSRLPAWIAGYQRLFPGVACSVVTNSQERLIRLLNDGQIDCAFVERSYTAPNMKSLFHFQERLSVIAPPGTATDAIPDMPLIVNNIETCPYRALLINWIFSKTHKFPAIIEFDTAEAICKAVSLGMGISLLPTILVSEKTGISSFEIEEISALNIHMLTLCAQQNREVHHFHDVLKELTIN